MSGKQVKRKKKDNKIQELEGARKTMVENGYSADRFLVSRQGKEVILEVQTRNENGEAETITFPISVRDVPWSKRNQIVTNSVMWDAAGQTKFDGDKYIREVLKYIVVDAPWGETNDTFLAQINAELGAALETIVPKAFDTGESTESEVTGETATLQNLDQVKKEFEDG